MNCKTLRPASILALLVQGLPLRFAHADAAQHEAPAFGQMFAGLFAIIERIKGACEPTLLLT